MKSKHWLFIFIFIIASILFSGWYITNKSRQAEKLEIVRAKTDSLIRVARYELLKSKGYSDLEIRKLIAEQDLMQTIKDIETNK